MAALPTSQTRKRRAPPFESQSPTIRRPVAVQLGRGGPFLTRMAVCALIHGLTWASSPFIRTPVDGQHHYSRGSKTSTYRVWAGSRMLPNQPLKNSSSSFSPLPPVPPPPDTLARENQPGEGAATDDRRPEASKPLKLQAENLQGAGGVPLIPGD